MTFITALNDLVASGDPFVSVTVVETTGSVPSEAGAKMLATASGRHSGTVGGGEIEQAAIEKALEMLSASDSKTELVDWNLARDLGMTCAGVVKLFFEVYNVPRWNVVIFGAGHVANALVQVLAGVDCRITCIDPRDEWLDKLPKSERIARVRTDDMPSKVATIPEGAFVLVMTMGHDTDRAVVSEILKTRELPYLGVIGSASKAKRLRAQLLDDGITPDKTESFVSPIGLPIGSNHPAEIAISVAAQLIEVRDRLKAES